MDVFDAPGAEPEQIDDQVNSSPTVHSAFLRAAALLSEGRPRLCLRRGQCRLAAGVRRCARRHRPRRSAYCGRADPKTSPPSPPPSSASRTSCARPKRRDSPSARLDDVKLAPTRPSSLPAPPTALAPEVAKLREQRAYGDALALIATLRPAVDTFFDKVMVLDPDRESARRKLGLIDRRPARILRHRRLQRDRDAVACAVGGCRSNFLSSALERAVGAAFVSPALQRGETVPPIIPSPIGTVPRTAQVPLAPAPHPRPSKIWIKMSDTLYLSLWYPNLRLAAIPDKLTAVLGAFAAHGGEPRVYAATVWPINWTETPIFQRVYAGRGAVRR